MNSPISLTPLGDPASIHADSIPGVILRMAVIEAIRVVVHFSRGEGSGLKAVGLPICE